MKYFAQLSERKAHIIRWFLLSGWLGLIASLLLSPWVDIDPIPGRLVSCANLGDCSLHGNDGNRLFWGVIIPFGILVIVAMGHDMWRRICPLAFVSQFFRALGWQRTGKGPGGTINVIRVKPESWLGRNHVQLQWTLFIAGLSLRLLVVNSSAFGLGLFLLLTVLAAATIGWAYGGKAWCQYVCPMGPVQTVLIGPRSLLGDPSHLSSSPLISQSMCRATSPQGGEKSTCVACQTPCIDIDSERSYWQTLRGKRGLTFAWYSYPGIILAFFFLLQWQGGADRDYLRSGRWAYDTTAMARIWTPLTQFPNKPKSKLTKPYQPKLVPPVLPDKHQEPQGLPATGSAQFSSPPVYLGPDFLPHQPPFLPDKGVENESGNPKELPRKTGQQLPQLPADFSDGTLQPGS